MSTIPDDSEDDMQRTTIWQHADRAWEVWHHQRDGSRCVVFVEKGSARMSMAFELPRR